VDRRRPARAGPPGAASARNALAGVALTAGHNPKTIAFYAGLLPNLYRPPNGSPPPTSGSLMLIMLPVVGRHSPSTAYAYAAARATAFPQQPAPAAS